MLAECINRSLNIGIRGGVKTAGQLGAILCYLELLESQFNQRLPLKDLREETIENAKRSEKAGLYFVENARFTQSISIFLERVKIIKMLATLVENEVKDEFSHVCEIPWKNEPLSALALYIDPPAIRSLTIWWMGPSEEINEVVDNLSQFDLQSLAPDYIRWVHS